jgi:hypothetical protein
MINWFRKENYIGYEDKLRDAFPKTMRSDLEAVLSILPFDDNIVKRTGQQIIHSLFIYNIFHTPFFHFIKDGRKTFSERS